MSMINPEYRNGGDGFILWAEENACVPIFPEDSDIPVWTLLGELPDDKHPETGKSYKDMWEGQKVIIREALKMEKKRFVHRLIVFCWPRGEGKSMILCLIYTWKFVCWIEQKLVLGANSKDQIRFVHYDIIRDIINHSPKILSEIGETNVKEKEIRLTDRNKNVRAFIRPISSFTGIVSNINGYTFSEMFDMKNPKFFTQLDGSIRNMPNSFGAIDSTVSEKSHVLYRLYQSYIKRKDPTLFFSYRSSEKGDPKDYWHPFMTQAQLTSYKEKFPLGDFERYFLNIWSAGSVKIFTEEMIEATNYLGVDKMINTHGTMIELLEKKNEIIRAENKMLEGKNWNQDLGNDFHIQKIEDRIWPVSDVMRLSTPQNEPKMATMEELGELTKIYDTDWVVLGGFDRADPMKRKTAARTITVVLAKGLMGSRSTPYIDEDSNPKYIYVLLGLRDVTDSSLEGIINFFLDAHNEFDGIQIIGSETWGAFDLAPWCEENSIEYEIFHNTYDKQKTMFSELFVLYRDGRFKKTKLAIAGSKEDDIMDEEAGIFDHDPDKRSFGSPEKTEKYGIQDDSMYATGAALYVGRTKGIADFRERTKKILFGEFFQPKGLLGQW